MLDVLEVQHFGSWQRQGPPRSSHHDVRAAGLDGLLVFLDADAAKEHAYFDGGHVLGKALVLLGDLESQLAGVTHYKHRHLSKFTKGNNAMYSFKKSALTNLCLKSIHDYNYWDIVKSIGKLIWWNWD